MLDEERINSFVRVMTKLQSEGLQVEGGKSALFSLANELKEKEELAPGISKDLPSDLKASLNGKKAEIEGTLKYLIKNQESLDKGQQQLLSTFMVDGAKEDPIRRLQRMSLAELTHAYDFLLNALYFREDLIKTRIKESLKHYKRDEKILFESVDYRKEN
jgi:hypothetical protein